MSYINQHRLCGGPSQRRLRDRPLGAMSTAAGKLPSAYTPSWALLFTAGLDMGLVMLPLTEFPAYAADSAYGFTNRSHRVRHVGTIGLDDVLPLGLLFRGASNRGLKIFEIAAVKWVYNLTVIRDMRVHLLSLPHGLAELYRGISMPARWAYRRRRHRGVRLFQQQRQFHEVAGGHLDMDVRDPWLSPALLAAAFFYSNTGLSGLVSNVGLLSDYFANLNRFVSPITEYHEFYLFWCSPGAS